MAQSLLRCALAVLILGAGSVSGADPIRVTAGSAGFSQGDPPEFHLIFDQGELFGDISNGLTLNVPANSPLRCDFPLCQAGGTVNLSTEWKQQSIVQAGAIIDGQQLQAFYDLSLFFHAGNATLPPLTADFVGVNVPFTMDGTVALFLDQARTTLLFSGTIAGQGTASAGFASRIPEGWFFGHQGYLFGPAATPTPEPGTLTLLVTGAAGALLQRKRPVFWRRLRSRDKA
jgi:hypothetical protein